MSVTPLEPAKARKVFEIGTGDQLVVLGSEGEGLALIKANDFLAFAEMMKLDIALDDRYAALKDVIAGRGKLTEKQELLFTIETVIPPRECKRF